MTYELAKELKDAGFPLHEPDWRQPGVPLAFKIDDVWYRPPTLEELIEACGQNLKAINNHQQSRWGHKRWTAKSRERELSGKFPRYVEYEGSTPTEAVARLWLSLQAK